MVGSIRNKDTCGNYRFLCSNVLKESINQRCSTIIIADKSNYHVGNAIDASDDEESKLGN